MLSMAYNPGARGLQPFLSRAKQLFFGFFWQKPAFKKMEK